jgi:hypothetical protein
LLTQQLQLTAHCVDLILNSGSSDQEEATAALQEQCEGKYMSALEKFD